MNPQLLRRQRFGLNPNKDLVAPDEELLDPYALAPPVAEDTLVDEDLPDVMPSPEYQDQEDPVTRYSPYKTEEFDKLRDMEPEDLQRRGPWHQILGGLADMTTVTRGLAPNLMYRNYDDVMNQKSAFERQQEKAALEAQNRGTDLSAGTAAYRTDATVAQNQWKNTVGLEYDARKRGLAPVNEIPSALLDPNVPVETINGKQYGTLRDKDVSFSYLEPDAETGKYVLVVLHKDDTITERPTNITPTQRSNTSGNLNTMIREAEIVRQQLQNPDLTDQQKAKLQSSLSILDNAIGKVKETEVNLMDERAKASFRYRTDGADTPEDTATLRQAIERFGGDREKALAHLYPDRREVTPGLPTAAETKVDTELAAGGVANVGDIDPGFLAKAFSWTGLGSDADTENAYNNLVKGNERIMEIYDVVKESRRENVPGFLPSLQANLDSLPKAFRIRFKDYINEYNANYPRLQAEGNDLWYDPNEGSILTPRTLVEDPDNKITTIEQAIKALQSYNYEPYKFVE